MGKRTLVKVDIPDECLQPGYRLNDCLTFVGYPYYAPVGTQGWRKLMIDGLCTHHHLYTMDNEPSLHSFRVGHLRSGHTARCAECNPVAPSGSIAINEARREYVGQRNERAEIIDVERYWEHRTKGGRQKIGLRYRCSCGVEEVCHKGHWRKGNITQCRLCGRSEQEKRIYDLLVERYPGLEFYLGVCDREIIPLRNKEGSRQLELDLVIEPLRLAIEVDGPRHDLTHPLYDLTQATNDRYKDQAMKQLGWELIRITYQQSDEEALGLICSAIDRRFAALNQTPLAQCGT